jgi:hypothetical protein
MGIVFTTMSLVYGTEFLLPFIWEEIHSDHPADFLAFSVIVYLVLRSNVNRVPIPRLFKIIAQDATYYFLVIFTSHLVVVMFQVFASVRISSQSSVTLGLTYDPCSLVYDYSLPCG